MVASTKRSVREVILHRTVLMLTILFSAVLIFLILYPEWVATILELPEKEVFDDPGFSKIFLCTYLVLFFMARHYWISKPGKNHLYAELNGLFLRMDTAETPDPKLTEAIRAEVLEIQEAMERHPYRQFFFGNTGIKISCWRRYHEAERLAIRMVPDKVLPQRLTVVAEDLSQFGSGSAQTLRDTIRNTLAEEEQNYERMRSQLVEAMKLIDDDRDNLAQYMADWQNKSTFMIALAVLMILFIIEQPNHVLFHFGMIGGLLAKMRGAINRKQASVDYGVSWATLFLTPLVGGITGWAGLLLLHFTAQLELLNLQQLLADSWETAHTSTSALALAMFFGYSATLFEKVLDKVQGEMEQKAKALQ